MYKIISYLVFIICLIGYSNVVNAELGNICSKWKITELRDGENRTMIGPGNFLKIDKTTIIEVMKEYGNRRYLYHRKENVLFVSSGDVTSEWKIIHLDSNSLHLDTPIGIYIMER